VEISESYLRFSRSPIVESLLGSLPPAIALRINPLPLSGMPTRRSALGQTRRFRDVRGMSGLTPTADISGPSRHFALVPIADLPTTGVAQLIQKLFGRDQIGGVETLREVVIDWLEAGGVVGGAALMP
jgi:hypothetical protein